MLWMGNAVASFLKTVRIEYPSSPNAEFLSVKNHLSIITWNYQISRAHYVRRGMQDYKSALYSNQIPII